MHKTCKTRRLIGWLPLTTAAHDSGNIMEDDCGTKNQSCTFSCVISVLNNQDVQSKLRGQTQQSLPKYISEPILSQSDFVSENNGQWISNLSLSQMHSIKSVLGQGQIPVAVQWTMNKT